jgi:hypothetical protein
MNVASHSEERIESELDSLAYKFMKKEEEEE